MIDGKVDVAELQLHPWTKTQLLQILQQRISSHHQTFITTPYSEFLFHALRDPAIRDLLNSADIAVPDGIGILWADYFLRQPFHFRNFYLKIVEAWAQVVYTGAAILLSPRKLYRTFPEKIVGADLFWDLIKMATENNFSVFLLGARGDTAERVKTILLQKFPSLQIVGTSNKASTDPSIIEQLAAAQPDLLFVAFQPLQQEQWIADHLKSLPTSLAIGLGGTFDYVAGNQPRPPRFVRQIGLEWLYRLITQPQRLGRIINAVPGLILSLVRYKVFMSMPYRQNAVAVAINSHNEVLIVRRNPHTQYGNLHEKFKNYWQFPQGGFDDGEDKVAASARELREETGLSDVKVLGVSESLNHYFWSNGRRNLLFNHLKFKGQEQHTVYFRYFGGKAEVVPDGEENTEFRWVTLENLVAELAPERQPHGRVVKADLERLILEKQG
jgi:N-acetylglucosaminyldiphosphoundecaprenol N-acetyl-beta-D-mannosaminyltransferase